MQMQCQPAVSLQVKLVDLRHYDIMQLRSSEKSRLMSGKESLLTLGYPSYGRYSNSAGTVTRMLVSIIGNSTF